MKTKGSKMQKSEENYLDDVLDVVAVHRDLKINLTKDVQAALGGVKYGDRLVIVKVDGGCYIKKRRNGD